jgi:hypothetical protein
MTGYDREDDEVNNKPKRNEVSSFFSHLCFVNNNKFYFYRFQLFQNSLYHPMAIVKILYHADQM